MTFLIRIPFLNFAHITAALLWPLDGDQQADQGLRILFEALVVLRLLDYVPLVDHFHVVNLVDLVLLRQHVLLGGRRACGGLGRRGETAIDATSWLLGRRSGAFLHWHFLFFVLRFLVAGVLFLLGGFLVLARFLLFSLLLLNFLLVAFLLLARSLLLLDRICFIGALER